jgi:diguanylate cyclase (GGDEF)-like protein
LNRVQNRPDAGSLAKLVQSAAHAAACRVGVLYLCDRGKFEIAANFGCSRMDAQVGRDFAVLNAAAQHHDALLVIPDLALAFPPARIWLFTDAIARFVAIVQVAFAHRSACGLLLVADTAPHSPSIVQQQMLRTHAAQITVLLEYENLRQTLGQSGQNGDTRAITAPSKASNLGTAGRYYRRARRAEAETITLAAEKAALEAEIQERRRIEARLHYVAFHDDLTSLHNRVFFMDRLAGNLQLSTADTNSRFAVLLVDLDGFKAVNDSFGHRTGDLLLIEIAQRLRGCVRTNDIVARIGGDEFAVLVEGFEDPAYVTAMAARLVEVLRHPVQLLGQEVSPAASIGAAHASKYYREPEELLRDADLAMYEAKRRRLGFLIFDDALYRTALVSTQLRNDLARALTRSEFFLEYQPIFNLATRQIEGFEALIRWQHPVRGVLPPSAFIGAAEEGGLIRQIGSWALRESCIQMRSWNEKYPSLGLRVSVNISAHQLTDGRFIPHLQEVLETTGLDPSALQLEVTESVFLADLQRTAMVIRDVKALGVGLTLDDFGTGYASLSYLDRYPIDAIKLDKSFVAGIPGRGRTLVIVKTIIELAQALNLAVTAEGIENDRQLQCLLSMGCGYAQGFLFSQPLASEVAEKCLVNKRWGEQALAGNDPAKTGRISPVVRGGNGRA